MFNRNLSDLGHLYILRCINLKHLDHVATVYTVRYSYRYCSNTITKPYLLKSLDTKLCWWSTSQHIQQSQWKSGGFCSVIAILRTWRGLFRLEWASCFESIVFHKKNVSIKYIETSISPGYTPGVWLIDAPPGERKFDISDWYWGGKFDTIWEG